MTLKTQTEVPEEPKRNMVFHRFLCFFLLWLCAAGSILTAVLCFSQPAEMNNGAYNVLVHDVLALDEDLTVNVAEPLFTCNTSQSMPRSEMTGAIAPEVTRAVGKICLLSAADGIVSSALPAVLGMTVTGSFVIDGILRILLGLTAIAAAVLLIRGKYTGSLPVMCYYLANTVLMVILMFPKFSFPYLIVFFANFLMAGCTTIYYVRRKHQMLFPEQ